MICRGFRSGVVIGLGSMVVPVLAALAPWAPVRGGDAPGSRSSPAVPAPAPGRDEPHRSPLALALSADGARLLTANQTAGSVSLVDVKAGRVLHELKTGEKPAGVAWSRDGRRGVVTHWYGYDLVVLEVKDDRLGLVGRIEVGP